MEDLGLLLKWSVTCTKQVGSFSFPLCVSKSCAIPSFNLENGKCSHIALKKNTKFKLCSSDTLTIPNEYFSNGAYV